MRSTLRLVSGAVALVAYAAVAHATMALPLDVDAMTDRADRIAVATVESQQARWTSGHGAIITEVTLRVTLPLKNARAGERIVVRREGGEVDGTGMYVPGAARFQDGEEVLVFLERRGSALYTVGMAQGRMKIALQNGHRVVVRETAGLGFLKPPAEPRVQPLDEVLARIQARVKQ